MQKKQPNVRYSARHFAKFSFFDVTKVRNAGLAMVSSQMAKNYFCDKRNSETRFGVRLYYFKSFSFLQQNRFRAVFFNEEYV